MMRTNNHLGKEHFKDAGCKILVQSLYLVYISLIRMYSRELYKCVYASIDIVPFTTERAL